LSITSKIPRLEEIAPVYAVIVMFVYPWTLTRYLWRLPSWILVASAGDLAAIFAYMLVVNLLESFLVLLAPLALSVILPRRWFYDHFKTKSVALVLFGFGFLIFLNTNLDVNSPFPLTIVRSIPVVAVAIVALVFLVDQVGFIRRGLVELADRLTVFLYISIPLSAISLLVVLIRNIF